MASYPDGTIFESAQTFPPDTVFGEACLFPDGCVFQNPCTFGDACMFGKGCRLIIDDDDEPPHKTGTACTFSEGCTIRYTTIGPANIIQDPTVYEPVSEGPDTLVGNQDQYEWPDTEVEAVMCSSCGQVVSGSKASKDWCDASQIEGFDINGDVTIRNSDYCIGED